MSRPLARAAATLALALLFTAGGCARSCGGGVSGETAPSAPSASTTTAAPLLRYFPLGRGDRWRTRGGSDGTMPRVFGVTAIDSAGVVVVFGGAGTVPERYTATATEIARVDEQGRALVPVLRAPLEEGASWTYALAERGVSIPCEARVVRIDATSRMLRGVQLSACLAIRRVCRYPAGTPFPVATTHTQEETYCPDVGLVDEEQHFAPPPAPGLLPSSTTERLVAWNVAGGAVPEPRAQLDCDDVLLMPSDVQAACGAGLAPVGDRTGVLEGAACVFRFAGGGRSVEVSVHPLAPDAPDPALPAAPEQAGDLRIPLQTRHAEITVRGCDDPRLAALLRSLFP